MVGKLRVQVMTPSDGSSDNYARIAVNLRLKQAGAYSVRIIQARVGSLFAKVVSANPLATATADLPPRCVLHPQAGHRKLVPSEMSNVRPLLLQVKAQYQSSNRFADASGTISSFVIVPECGYSAPVASAG